jgi:hypothetical protein
MHECKSNFDPRRFGARLTKLLIAFTSVWSFSAHAQLLDSLSPEATTTSPPYALVQYSTLTGSGDTITATRVPVVISSGTIYKNITLQFAVDSLGNLTVAAGYPKVVPATTPLTSSFLAGTYVGPSTIYSGEMILTVSGPGIAPGGATEWSLASAKGAYVYTYPNSATWYVGPIASSPIAARVSKAGITSTTLYYGIGGSQYGEPWSPDALLGFSQNGKALTIFTYTDGNGDHSQPVGQVTYMLSQ